MRDDRPERFRFLTGTYRRRLVIAACSAIVLDANAAPGVVHANDNASAVHALATLVHPFEASSAADDPRLAFAARTAAGGVFVTHHGRIVHSLRGDMPGKTARAGRGADPSRAAIPRWVLTETLVGARAKPRAATRSETRVARFVGSDPSRWNSEIATYDRISLGEAWPGIVVDLVARGDGVEKLFTLAASADPSAIAVRIGGARRLERAADGALVAHTGRGAVRFTAPVAWQDIDGERRAVHASYTLSRQHYGFALGNHSREHPVFIDPLLQATYLGGGAGDVVYAIAVDASGDVLVAGSTSSFNFPGTTAGAQPASGGNSDAFVARFDHALTRLKQATYIGGSGNDIVQAIAIDASGTVFIAGTTGSTNFPATSGGAQPGAGGGGDAFVARLNATLTRVEQSTYLGGSGAEEGFALVTDGTDNVYVVGSTGSANFPGVSGGAQPTRGAGVDAFVAKIDATLRRISAATYLGGNGNDVGYGLRLASDGTVYVAGSTFSTNLPGVTFGAQPVPGGGGDAFVARLDNLLRTLMRSTYLGGTQTDAAYALALGPDGSVYVSGETASTNFPRTAGGAQPNRSAATDAFVARLDGELGAIIQSTYLGGLGNDVANAVSVDATTANVYVAGNTASLDFPGTAGGAQSAANAAGDAFAARLSNTLGSLLQATYFGGFRLDQAFAFTVDVRGSAYIAGGTSSVDLPGTTGGAQPTANINGDGFVARFTASLRLIETPAIEYRYPEWDHYFVTANEDEIAKLDAGVFGGWVRTGESFRVLPLDTAGTADVCRFFSVSFAPKSSHFYTPYADECELVKQNPDWQYEGQVFAVVLPGDEGQCAIGTVPLYRLYNDGQGGAPNHRYTTSMSIRNEMLQQGWIAEGKGALGVMGCVPGDARSLR